MWTYLFRVQLVAVCFFLFFLFLAIFKIAASPERLLQRGQTSEAKEEAIADHLSSSASNNKADARPDLSGKAVQF